MEADDEFFSRSQVAKARPRCYAGCESFSNVPTAWEPVPIVPRPEDALTLYIAHRGRLLNYASGILGDASRAEDVVQDAWLRLDQAVRRGSVRYPLQLLYQIVRNLAIDSLRRSARDARVGSGDMEVAERVVADPKPSAESGLLAREDLRTVLDVLETLPERQRTAIELYRFQGLKLREIGERLGMSTSSAHLLIVEGLALCAAIRRKGG